MMNKTILVIEDDISVLKNLEVILKQEKYNVISASNGVEGVTLAKKHKPDLIICDIIMPKMNGYEVLNALAIDSAVEVVPFLFLTAKTNIADMRKGMGLGADDYLIKPYNIDDLLHAIKTRINKFNKIKSKQLSTLDENLGEDKKLSDNDIIMLTVNNESKFIKTKSIVFIIAERQYTKIVFNDSANMLIRKSLNYWESVLSGNSFLRIHRSTIINYNYILRMEKSSNNSYEIFLKDNFGHFVVSKRYASKLRKHKKL